MDLATRERMQSMARETMDWMMSSVRSCGWAPILVFGSHVVVSKGGGYDKWPALDIPMHFMGGVAIAYFLWGALSRPELPGIFSPHPIGMRLLAAFGWVGISAVLWELAEWSADTLGLAQAQANLGDTMLDMFLGLLGGGVYLALVCCRK